MRKIRLACLQMPVKNSGVQDNLEFVLRKLSRLRPGAVDLVCLPEMWSTDYFKKNAAHLAQESAGAVAALAGQAKRLNCWILGSSLTAAKKGKNTYWNAIAILGPRPRRQKSGGFERYEKIHLFRPLREDRQFSPGKDLRVVRAKWGRIGLSICYDLRFPELYRALAARGAEIIVVPSAWPAARTPHWQTLLKARAIENQVFVVGVNRVGNSHRGFPFAGKSTVIDPWGEVLWEGTARDPELVVVEIDLDRLKSVRKQITVWKDREPRLYLAWQRRERQGKSSRTRGKK